MTSPPLPLPPARPVTIRPVSTGASSFASPLNNWNVSKVQDFRALFVFTPYNSPLNNWNTSSATDMGEMFNVAGSFNQDISNWNVSKFL